MPVSSERDVATDSPVQDAHSCDRTVENISHVSARFEEGTTVPASTQAEMSYGPRSTDTSDCSWSRAHLCDRIAENAPRVSVLNEEGTIVGDATPDTSDLSRIRAHTRERIGESARCTSAAFDEGATVQAAHGVAAAIEEGTTVPAGTQAETGFGRRSADKLVPNVWRSPEHIRESSGKAVPWVTTSVSTLGSPVPRISFHTRVRVSEVGICSCGHFSF